MVKRRGLNEAFRLNNKAQGFYYSRLKLLATTCFKWEGLPNNIPERFIENTLYYNGIVAFADDKDYGLICCKCTPSGMLNIYNEPVEYQLNAVNGYCKNFKTEDLVIVRNNTDLIPTIFFTDYYIKQLFEIDRAIQTNVVQQKTSKIIACEESQKLTLENLLMQYEGNVPFIFGYKGLTLSDIKDIDLTSPYVADKLQNLKKEVWRECMDVLGIKNANTSKKERLITDEVNSNDQLLDLSSDVFLKSRKLACDELYEKFGLEVEVERRIEEEDVYNSDDGETDRE